MYQSLCDTYIVASLEKATVSISLLCEINAQLKQEFTDDIMRMHIDIHAQ